MDRFLFIYLRLLLQTYNFNFPQTDLLNLNQSGIESWKKQEHSILDTVWPARDASNLSFLCGFINLQHLKPLIQWTTDHTNCIGMGCLTSQEYPRGYHEKTRETKSYKLLNGVPEVSMFNPPLIPLWKSHPCSGQLRGTFKATSTLTWVNLKTHNYFFV